MEPYDKLKEDRKPMGKIETGKISEVTRYVNGVKVKKEDMKKITIANPIVLAILQKIDERIAQQNNDNSD